MDELEKKLAEEEKAKKRAFIGSVPQIGMFPSCQHCYCGEGDWNGKAHMVCCMCGHRTLQNPITY